MTENAGSMVFSVPWRLNMMPGRFENFALWHCFTKPCGKDLANL
jgi:hypothetical protein